MVTSLSLDEARRLALTAQGFGQKRPRSATVRHLRDTIRRLGLLQIDCVNVVCAAHYMVPFSRLGPYDRAAFDDLIYRSGEFAKHWAHEISIIPAETRPLLRYRRETDRVRPWGFAKVLEERADYAAWVLEEVRRRGASQFRGLAGQMSQVLVVLVANELQRLPTGPQMGLF
jgi:uncharacterized protein YcaQ